MALNIPASDVLLISPPDAVLILQSAFLSLSGLCLSLKFGDFLVFVGYVCPDSRSLTNQYPEA